jgi:hypothetical protein
MNNLPNDIIISELFPKLKLSKIFDLTIAYPPWLPIVKKYILDIGHQLSPDMLQEEDHKVVLKSLVYNPDIFNRFINLKHAISLFVYLLTIGFNSKMEEVENDLCPRIQKLYQDFSEDMMEHLDTIFSNPIIHLPSLLFVVRNKPSDFVLQGNYDFRILTTLFPTFSLKFNTLLKDYLFRMKIDNLLHNSIIDEVKTEINRHIYNMFIS